MQCPAEWVWAVLIERPLWEPRRWFFAAREILAANEWRELPRRPFFLVHVDIRNRGGAREPYSEVSGGEKPVLCLPESDGSEAYRLALCDLVRHTGGAQEALGEAGMGDCNDDVALRVVDLYFSCLLYTSDAADE